MTNVYEIKTGTFELHFIFILYSTYFYLSCLNNLVLVNIINYVCSSSKINHQNTTIHKNQLKLMTNLLFQIALIHMINHTLKMMMTMLMMQKGDYKHSRAWWMITTNNILRIFVYQCNELWNVININNRCSSSKLKHKNLLRFHQNRTWSKYWFDLKLILTLTNSNH